MGIRPKGGWDDPPPEGDRSLVDSRLRPPVYQQAQQPSANYVYLAQPQSSGGYFQCKVCDRGMLAQKKVFRMSPPVVVIGFILLIPCVIGMLISLIGMFGGFIGTGVAVATDSESINSKRAAVVEMQEVRVPRRIINAVVNHQTGEIEEWINSDYGGSGPPPRVEQDAVKRAQNDLAAESSPVNLFHFLGPLIGFSSLFFGVASFVGGLLGWLLVMRRRVLQCAVCGAVVNAS